MTCAPPSTAQTLDALARLADLLEIDCAFARGGRFYFPLSGAWSLALSTDSAARFRVDACIRSVPVSSLWALVEDDFRLEEVATALKDEVLSLT